MKRFILTTIAIIFISGLSIIIYLPNKDVYKLYKTVENKLILTQGTNKTEKYIFVQPKANIQQEDQLNMTETNKANTERITTSNKNSKPHVVFPISNPNETHKNNEVPCLIPGAGWTMTDILKRNRGYPRNWVWEKGQLNLTTKIQKEVVASSKNRSHSSSVLYYNRVPKCGSSEMRGLIKKLSYKNKFKTSFSNIFWRHKISVGEEKLIISQVKKSSGTLFDRHIYHLDWDRQGANIDLINLVREPISRVISMFYYNRKEKRWHKRAHRPPVSWFKKTFDECVLTGDPECNIGGCWQEMQLSYFCGSHTQCSNSTNRAALQLAKYNVENKFTVVGVLESFKTSLFVMEKYLPRWFTGAASLYSPEHKANVNAHKDPNKKVTAEISKRLKMDIEFYHFVVQRLQIQFKYLNKYKHSL